MLLQNRLHRTEILLREQGPFALAGRVLRRITRLFVETGGITVFARDLSQIEPGVEPGRRVRQLQPSDREAILHGSESSWETLSRRFSRGDLCFAGLDDQGRAAHTRWLTFTRAPIPEVGLDFVPPKGSAYFYDGYTRPDARRQGIDGQVRAAIFSALGERGCSRVYSYVRNDNPIGLRAAARCQTNIGQARFTRVLRSRPLVSGVSGDLASLLHPKEAEAQTEAAARAADWKRWFEGWLKEPIEKRSIGFHELPAEAFRAMADHVAATLGLDPTHDSVLDVGCDSALVTRFVSPRCKRLTGVDFIPGLLLDAERARRQEGRPEEARFAAADGRSLPFPSNSFDKAYGTGVVHTLPTHQDGLAMILEMVRVVKPGGKVLVAAVPDIRKRGAARREAWRLGDWRERARLVAALVIPSPLRRLVHRIAPSHSFESLRYLEYDLRETAAGFGQLGLECQVADYPKTFWSRDFRETRSNLIISKPL